MFGGHWKHQFYILDGSTHPYFLGFV